MNEFTTVGLLLFSIVSIVHAVIFIIEIVRTLDMKKPQNRELLILTVLDIVIWIGVIVVIVIGRFYE